MSEVATAGTELTRRLYQSMWAALGGSGDLESLVGFAGGEVLPGPFAVSHVGAASFAAVGAAIADLVSTATGRPPAVRVDRTLASVWLAYWSAPVGWERTLDPPGFLEPGGSNGGGDLTLGKRCVYLDLSTQAGRDTFLTLLPAADVLVHGLRPGALDGLGLGADARRAAAPGIIEVTLNAYGWTGPWRGRRGFDTLVQTSAGMSTELMRRGGLPGPKLLPSQVLDFATGYLVAAAAIRGLAERARHGRWSTWRLALARTGALLRSAGEAPGETALGEPADRWYEDRVYNFPKGPVRRLVFPTTVEDAPQFWERAGDPYGTATPVWATAQTAARSCL